MKTEEIKSALARLEQLIKSIKVEQKGIYNPDEAASFLGISKSHLYRLTHTNQISYSQPGGKKIYFSKADLIEYIKKNKIKAIDLDKIAAEAASLDYSIK